MDKKFSKSEVKRLAKADAIELNGKVIYDPMTPVKMGARLK